MRRRFVLFMRERPDPASRVVETFSVASASEVGSGNPEHRGQWRALASQRNSRGGAGGGDVDGGSGIRVGQLRTDGRAMA